MKIITIFLLAFLSATMLHSQSVSDGEQQLHHQRFNTAETTFKSILKADPSNAQAWALLMRTYVREGKYKSALDSLALVPASVNDDPFYHVAAGTVSLATNDQATAKNHFEQAIDKTKGKNVPVLEAIAAINIESPNGDYNYAIEVLQKGIKKDKKNASLYTSLGQAYLKQHNGSEAYKAFMEAIAKNDKEATAYYELGNIFLSQKNKDLYIENYGKAVTADPAFGPAYFKLYNHYLYTDPAKATDYFRHYAINSDPSVQQEYSYTDLLYLTKKYDSAIAAARQLIEREGDSVQPRLYKLISYSYQGKGDSVSAMPFMTTYFEKEEDSNFVRKDFETMAQLYLQQEGKGDSAIAYYKKALSLATTNADKSNYYKALAALARQLKNYGEEASWQGQIYTSGTNTSNITLFNWGLAAYRAQDYRQADSVFGIYTTKYPKQGFGYYWRARANAGIDTAMTEGLAVPYYQNLLAVINVDSLTTTDKKWMKEAYGYLASYEANTEQDYAEAINYFQQLLKIDPENEQVEKNIDILEKNLAARNKTEETGSK